ncbi:MAG TPA: sugar ABC transporter substrate-binding protein [Aggregatilineaceae bacterium]|nr:sugar ABC transporter substrate-binding protein [Aggregatilineaceae bacterium]
MKMQVFALALIMVLVLSLAPTTTTSARDEVTITYAIWDNNQLPAHEQIMDAFMEANPGIKVDIQVVPWGNYWEKLQTAVAGGEAYDVFWMNGPNFPVYASRGVLMNLQELVDAGNVDLSVYPESLVNLYSYDGSLYGIPKDFDTIGLYYNVDMFDDAGVEYPTADWTWDDLKAAAEKLTRDGNWGIAATLEDQSNYWNLIYQNGGQVINEDGSAVLLNESAACDAIKFNYSFVEAGYSPDGATMSSVDPAIQLFPGGKVAMIFAGSWMARTYADAEPNINVAPLPQGTQRATIIHGLANVAWSGTKHPEEAQALVKFLGSEEAALILAQSGTVIPAYEGMQQAWVDALPEMNLQESFIDALEYAVPYPTAAKGMEWNTKIAEVLGEVWAGNISPDEMCAMAADAANEVLQADE